MKASRDTTIFIDLSFLSPEEEAVIQNVLVRDEDLKKHEIGRVRKLRETVPDSKQLKVLSGEWFEDLKSKRYGRQPHVSAVVRSSMRWKKTAGHSPNPFLKAVPEDKGGEKNKTRPGVYTDPRSIHPALSVQVQQENKDEAMVLEESSGAELNKPVLKVIEAGRQSGPKFQDQTPCVESLKMKPTQVSKTKDIDIKILDPGRTELKEDRVVETIWDTRDPGKTEVKREKEVKAIWDTRDPGRTEVKREKEVKTIWDTRDPGRTELKEDSEVKTIWDAGDPGRTELKREKEVKTILSTRDPGKTELKEDRVVETICDTRDPGKTEVKREKEVKTIRDTKDSGKTELKEDRVVETVWDTRDPGKTEVKRDKEVKAIWNTRDPRRAELKEDSEVKTIWDSRDPERTELKRDKEVKTSWDTRDPGRTELKEQRVVETHLEKRPKQTDGKTFRNFEIRSFSQAQESSNWGFGQLGSDEEPIKPQSEVEVVIINSNNRTEPEVKNKQESLRPQESRIPVSSGSGFEEKIPSPVPKKRSFEKIRVVNINSKQKAPTRMEESSVDLSLKEDPGVLVDLKRSPGNNMNTQVYFDVDQKSLDPVKKGEESAVKEIIVEDFNRRSPTRTEELSDPDILEGPGNNVNTAKSVSWEHKTLDPEQAVEEIIVAEFKQRSPKRLEELIVSLNMDQNPEIVKDLETGPGQKDGPKNEKSYMKRDELPDSAMETQINEAAGGRNGFGVKSRESERADQKVSKEIEKMEKGRRGDENGISESDILASVYARATRPKSGVSKKTPFSQEPVQKTADVIPTIVIVPSESEEPDSEETERKSVEVEKNETPTPEAVVEVAKPGTDTWEDVAVDSDDDSSSVSSHDSDLSGKRSQLTASTLSVKERTASLLSVYSDAGDFGNVAVQGSVEFALMYSPLGELVIMVEQCQDLAIANARKQRTDPYVKTYLYPDKRSKRKTSIKKRTVNPVFVESLRYKVKREELHGKTFNLSVWHNDSRGRNAFLGQVEINLKDWDWKHEALTWYNLQPKSPVDNLESQEYRGVLFVSLKYMPPEAIGGSKVSQPTGEIHIWLREAKHLRCLKTQGVDSFVKCYMLPDTSKKSRQKTRVVKKTQDPVYNHTMVYDGFRVGELCEACCELTVWDNNKLSNQFLGGARLSLGTGQSYGKKVDWMDSENEEVEIWKKMMANPNSWVEAELPLRASMTPRK